MRLIIAGGRDVHLDDGDYALLDFIHAEVPVTEVVSGTASGVDTCGEDWAVSRGIPVKRFEPRWKINGSAAGPLRNMEMAKYAQGKGALIVFPGGRGTDNMYETACALGLPVFDMRYRHADKPPTG